MSVMFTCLLISMILPFIPRLFVAYAQYKDGYNNRVPRIQQARLTGVGQRAVGAHLNSFEALLLFACAVLIAYVNQVDPAITAPLARVFVISRVLYIALYLADKPLARSTVWMVGFGLTLMLAMAHWIF
ncbi:MAG: hypothetical protein RIQ81_1905 [Pseudomonadota bacterium]|jgi:uncharacterized MAPEG superfamily protein